MHRQALQVLLLSLACVVSAAAQTRTLWKIGSFDQSGDEFGAQSTVAPFVGTSQPQDWTRTQEAVTPGKADTGANSRRIRFNLDAAPRGTFTLRVGLIARTPRLPVVQLDVNGHRGWFHQRFETDFREANWEPSIFPQYAVGALDAEIPAEFLRQGANEIALVAVTDPVSTALPGGGATDAAVLAYDALELRNDQAAQTTAGIVSAEATPTVYFKRDGARVSEIVSVRVRWNALAPKGEVTLSLPGSWHVVQALTSGLSLPCRSSPPIRAS